MNRKYYIILSFCLLMVAKEGFSQLKDYYDSTLVFQKDYTDSHGIIKGDDKKNIRFFPIDKAYRINARFEEIIEAPWFKMETSGTEKKMYRTYGILHFKLNGKSLKLQIYQSKELMNSKAYADYLFIPFTDQTCGNESYENGRYLDLRINELNTGNFVLDFNKAYNPYCAYISNYYNCPIPPKENELQVAVKAGEMKYEK